ncbi:hypothetical protein [Haloarcula litorea]|uniref:hypothetical protein n=1 Tax=Haloarcula litorea TaxID=3032579 RepID=UPI0023E7FCB2|nr:hypothetical protein [Halomicroarcula sp. GDY20]
MSRTGLCQICESAPADHSCDQCGNLVCDDDWDDDLGFCAECAARARRGGVGRDEASGRGVPDDEDTLRF